MKGTDAMGHELRSAVERHYLLEGRLQLGELQGLHCGCGGFGKGQGRERGGGGAYWPPVGVEARPQRRIGDSGGSWHDAFGGLVVPVPVRKPDFKRLPRPSNLLPRETCHDSSGGGDVSISHHCTAPVPACQLLLQHDARDDGAILAEECVELSISPGLGHTRNVHIGGGLWLLGQCNGGGQALESTRGHHRGACNGRGGHEGGNSLLLPRIAVSLLDQQDLSIDIYPIHDVLGTFGIDSICKLYKTKAFALIGGCVADDLDGNNGPKPLEQLPEGRVGG
mmetsp:Transcript_128695/g.222335  ORF Transcript_128695/g.222335 Transcript_128695/m.222335 type:complete len:280 (-) Transcript_128695:234-1073(-)